MEVSDSLFKLGRLYKKQHWYSEAKSHFQRAAAMAIVSLGTEGHPKVASSWQAWADVLRQDGQYEEAQELYERALAVNEAIHGECGWREEVSSCSSGGRLASRQSAESSATVFLRHFNSETAE